jgi:pimeloyl-ACP methyl ester carboxylesterase
MYFRVRNLILSLALLWIAASPGQPNPFGFNQEPYSHAQRLVSVGSGRRLNIYCTGKGSPTVILDLGFGAPLISWGLVQPEIAENTRVCSYERAGYGFSDPGPLPRTTRAIVDDLHALLKNAGERPPYVMVGHSMAGLDALLYADLYPSEVSGIVLIDPLLPGWDEVVERMFPQFRLDGDRFIRSLAMCQNLAEKGELRTRSSTNKDCLPPQDPRFTAEVQRARDATKQRPGYWSDLQSEASNEDSADVLELNSGRRDFGSTPLILLSAPLNASTYEAYRATATQIATLASERTTFRQQVVDLSQRGIVCDVGDTGHFIQLDRPGIVLHAIRQVLHLTRSSARPSCSGL